MLIGRVRMSEPCVTAIEVFEVTVNRTRLSTQLIGFLWKMETRGQWASPPGRINQKVDADIQFFIIMSSTQSPRRGCFQFDRAKVHIL